MGSYQVSNFRHGFSKSQMCLQKILKIISSYPCPRETSKESSSIPKILEFDENRGLGIDLNVELFPWPEVQESESLSASHDSAADFMAEKSSSEGECDNPKSIREIGKVSADINLERKQVKEKEKEDDFLEQGVKASPSIEEEEKKHKTNDCFSLLVEAAKMVSGNSKEKEAKESESAQVGGGPSPAEENMEEISPVVRSKRGRSQVLPLRYRDSVIEPWKRQPRPQGPPATAAPIVSTKRGKFNNNKQIKSES